MAALAGVLVAPGELAHEHEADPNDESDDTDREAERSDPLEPLHRDDGIPGFRVVVADQENTTASGSGHLTSGVPAHGSGAVPEHGFREAGVYGRGLGSRITTSVSVERRAA